jgi:hypothetical protein
MRYKTVHKHTRIIAGSEHYYVESIDGNGFYLDNIFRYVLSCHNKINPGDKLLEQGVRQNEIQDILNMLKSANLITD